ncbi:MAG: hypothetical protein D6732_20795 [Methanobacteriota archaeon]|nr:MAG: hypothetical protein D6732_20795 [Euryarchaeota archaeon]
MNLLAIFAHPDDELGCAGTLLNHVESGDQVHLMFLTKGENSSFLGGTAEDRARKRIEHTKKIEDLLGVKVHFMDFPDSRVEVSVNGAYEIAEKIKEIRPHGIITWNLPERYGSGHPDHRACSKLVYDAMHYARYRKEDSPYEPWREQMSLFQYHDPANDPWTHMVYVDVTDKVKTIYKFIEIYQEAYGTWPVKEFKETMMKTYGRIANVEYAEAFRVILRSFKAPKTLPLT